MRSHSKCVWWLCTGLLMGSWTATALSASPIEQLEQAVELFRQGEYERSQELLLSIDQDGLDDDQKSRRNELVEEVATAINQSAKARQNLADAEKALKDNDPDTAGKRFQSVIENNFASAEQKEQAERGLERIADKASLERELIAEASGDDVGESESMEAEAADAGTEQSTSEETTVETTETTVTETTVTESTTTVEDLREARRQRSAAEAMRLVAVGDAALAQGQFDLAEQKFQSALALVPDHPEALKGLDMVRDKRAVEGRPSLLDDVEGARRLRWQRTVRMFDQSEREIRVLINDREYEAARQKLALTRQLLDAGRRDAEPAEAYNLRSRQLDALGNRINEEQRDYEEEQVRDRAIEARKIESERITAVDRERAERVSHLLDQVMQLQKERRYDEAIDLLEQVVVIDPTYQQAQWLLEELKDIRLIRSTLEDRRYTINQIQDGLRAADQARRPDVLGEEDGFVAYPSDEDWRIIAKRDPFGASLAGDSDADRRAWKKLESVIQGVEFADDTPFEDAIEYLRTQSGASINVNWNALENEAFITRDQPLNGISVGDVSLEAAMNLVLETVGGQDAQLGFDVVDGVIRISTRESLDRRTITRTYDIRDLLIRIKSFEPPDSTGAGGGFGGGGGGFGGGGFGGGGGGFGGGGGGFGGGGGGFGGGGGGGGFGGGGGGGGDDDDDASEEDRQELIDDLEDLIKDTIEPDSWKPEGNVGSLSVWNDRLIVNHAPNVHRQLRDLFTQLREAKDLQIAVEARFITLQSNFIEEIGVDLDIVLNGGNAGLDSALVQGQGGFPQRAVNPVTGGALLQPRQFTRLGFLPNPAGFGQPLGTSQTFVQPYENVGLVPLGQPGSHFSQHTTAVPLITNTLGLAAPRDTGIPGSLASQVANSPGFQMFGSFLDNIQVDFLLRASQVDVRSSLVDAPRLVIYNGRRANIIVGTFQNYVARPGIQPVGGSGVSGQASLGRPPDIGQAFSGRTLDVTATVSGDRKYVTMTVKPVVQTTNFQVFPDSTGAVQLPAISTTSIETNVTVPDRGWLLLGGLKLAGETEAEAGVPILSKIPVLKRGFTNRSKTKDEQIILVLIKPSIIIPEEQEDKAYPPGLIEGQALGG